jgi:hypothetical protein
MDRRQNMCTYLNKEVRKQREKQNTKEDPATKWRGTKIELYVTLAVTPLRKTILLAGHYESVGDAYIWYHFHNIASRVFASTPICIQTLL